MLDGGRRAEKGRECLHNSIQLYIYVYISSSSSSWYVCMGVPSAVIECTGGKRLSTRLVGKPAEYPLIFLPFLVEILTVETKKYKYKIENLLNEAL